MPSFAPRNEPRKKKEELELKKLILKNAILNGLALEIISKKAEIYKTAIVSYNKAILHVINDYEWKNKTHSFNKEKATREIQIWQNKNVETIISEIKINYRKVYNGSLIKSYDTKNIKHEKPSIQIKNKMDGKHWQINKKLSFL